MCKVYFQTALLKLLPSGVFTNTPRFVNCCSRADFCTEETGKLTQSFHHECVFVYIYSIACGNYNSLQLCIQNHLYTHTCMRHRLRSMLTFLQNVTIVSVYHWIFLRMYLNIIQVSSMANKSTQKTCVGRQKESL